MKKMTKLSGATLQRAVSSPLSRPTKNGRTYPGVPGLVANTQQLLHELQVHQVELEMQNAELRQARDQLEGALENYTNLYDFAPVSYFTLTETGLIRQVNLTGSCLVGIERSRLLNRAFGLMIAAEHRALFKSFLGEVFANSSKQRGDFQVLCQGQPFKIVNIEAQRLPEGSECRAVVVDITERREAEDKVRISEIRYRRLFEAAHDGVLLLNPTTRKISDANPFMTKLLNYSHDQLVGKELFEIGLLKDEVASQEMFEKLKRKHEVRYEDLPLESKGGRHQEVEVVANLYQENGRPVIQCNIRDITERKQAVEALRRNEALFSSLVMQAPVGVYVVDAQMQLQQVNRVAKTVFKNVHPLIGRSFAEVVRTVWPRRVAEQVVERFRYTLKTGKPYQSLDFAERRRDIGVKEFFEWQIQRVTLPAGELGVVCFFNNITERKRAEEARRRLEVVTASNRKLHEEIVRRQVVEDTLKKSEQHQADLLEQSRAMEEHLRQLSRQVLQAQEDERKRISRELHDVIAQTLSSINVRLATLKAQAGQRNKGFDRTFDRTQRLVEESVNSVQLFARELRPAVLDDLGLIPALQAYMKNFTTRTGVRTHLTAFAGVEKLDGAKRTTLFRVTQEALTNVARHAKASQVEIHIQKQAKGLSLSIHDNGRSFQVQKVLLAKGSKRLGLLGMRERVEMVGGQFEIKSARGEGTTIHLQIPSIKKRGGGEIN